MAIEEGDIVLCTVERIVGTVVFVKIESNGKEAEGSIVFSEIAPGRIRNIRDYVVPKKKIVCKVLRILKNRNIDLSLRRVTQKEKKEVLEAAKQEKSYTSILKSVLKEKAEDVIKKIKEETGMAEFLDEAKENPKKLEKLVGKKDSKRILEILKSQKQKKTVVKKRISVKSTASDGLQVIKNLFGNLKDIKVKYISAGNYSIEKESENPKQADNALKEVIADIEKKSGKNNFSFSVN